jgi:serine/threonine-protein kinase RsbW
LKNDSKILNIKSNRTELKKVEHFLSDFFIDNKLSLKEFNKVLLCVSEAVVNSIDHGNQNDKNKNIFIEIRCVNKNIDVKVKDEGCGFDYSNLEDPTKKENLRKETGRGIHIIRSLCDEVEFRNKGNCVRFKVNVGE